MNHIMIDLETYSTKSNAVIRSIGVVLFNMQGETKELMHVGINTDSCLMVGLEVDQDTINFWRKQPEEKREKLLKLPTIDLSYALNMLQGLVEELRTEVYVWSHGSNFDTVILANAYKAIGQVEWWKYSHVRDTRTLFDIAEHKYVSKGGHDALEDAKEQVIAVCEAYTKLHGGSKWKSLTENTK